MEDRSYKIDRILEEYNKRGIQKEVAEMFNMKEEEVSKVTRLNNYWHTRKITPENKRPGEKISLFTHLDDYEFLDKYPIEDFKK